MYVQRERGRERERESESERERERDIFGVGRALTRITGLFGVREDRN